MSDKVIGYKGFDKNFRCSQKDNSQQYDVGKTAEHKGEIKLCSSGFHFCENPFDVWKYYPVLDDKAKPNRFAIVEAEGVSANRDCDSKRVAKKLTLTLELSLKTMIEAGVKFFLEKIDFSKEIKRTKKYRGYAAKLAASGYAAQLAASGDDAQLAASGNAAKLDNTGARGIMAGIGVNNKARGKVGCWLILAEHEDTKDGWRVKNVQTTRIDGKKIKADTYYALQDGKFVEDND